MKRIRWTLTAKKSINQIHDFLETIWGIQIADHFLELVDNQINYIVKNPEIGK